MLIKQLDFIYTCFKLNFKTALEYRLSFLGQMFAMVINDIFWIIFWYIFFGKISAVRGWEFKDVLMLFGMSAFAFGISSGLFANRREIARLIEEGGLDFYLTLPKDPLLHILLGKISISSLGDLVFSIALVIAVKGLAPLFLLRFILAGILAGIILTAFSVTVHSFTFFTGRGSGFANFMIETILCFSMYPLKIFDGIAKILLFTVIPAAFISTIPVSIVKDFTWEKFFILAGVAIVSVVISRMVFFYGLKRYTSGNLISARL
ncbi:MAG: ABC-2 family transporter protein [Candidatus Eremiobacterota bacterium]